MESIFLIGNGLNRAEASGDYPSWENLMLKIGNDLFSETSQTDSELLKFEQLVCNALAIQPSQAVSHSINCRLMELENITIDESSLHAQVWQSGVKTVLTTNFDYALERGLFHAMGYSDEDKKKHYWQETVASKLRHTEIKERNIYHIHGELELPKSICLGQIHYATNLMRVMEALDTQSKDSDDADGFRLRESIVSGDTEIKTWAEYFFTKNVFILGLGLYECDFDLWWLISYRAKLLQESSFPIKNSIYYFNVKAGEDDSPVVDILRNLRVNILPQTVEGEDWKSAYSACIAKAKKMIDQFGAQEL